MYMPNPSTANDPCDYAEHCSCTYDETFHLSNLKAGEWCFQGGIALSRLGLDGGLYVANASAEINTVKSRINLWRSKGKDPDLL